jgi:hypothetical protein
MRVDVARHPERIRTARKRNRHYAVLRGERKGYPQNPAAEAGNRQRIAAHDPTFLPSTSSRLAGIEWRARLTPMPAARLTPANRLGIGLLVLALAWIAWDTVIRAGHALALSADYGVAVDAPPFDPASSTGYADGRRSLLLPTGAADGAHWAMQTQSQLARGDLRVRFVDYDNAPHGREVHWASPLRGWLTVLAGIDLALGNGPLGVAVERAALWSGPLMLALALPLLFFWTRRALSPAAAALLPLMAIAFHPFAIDFLAGRADHHGIANLAALICVLAFALGDLKPSSASHRLSAAAAGIGLWISAVTLVPVLIGLGLGVVAAAYAVRRSQNAPPSLVNPDRLRAWATTGALVSVGAYLLETVPGPFPLRLEVNHPWYALAWWGAGETLAALVARLRGLSLTRTSVVRAMAGAAALVSLPAAVLLTRAETYRVADPFLLALHNEHIAEFQSVLRIAGTQGLTLAVAGLVLPLLAWTAPLLLLRRRELSAARRATLLAVSVPALIATALGLLQVRWLGLAFATGAPAVLVAWHLAFDAPAGLSRRIRIVTTAALAGLFLPGLLATLQRTVAAGETTTEDIRHLAERDLAHWLRLRAGDETVTLAAPPGLTTRLLYHGSHRGLGTLYWENAEGLKRLARFYAAESPDEARRLATEAGLTHIVFVSWDAFEVPLIHLHRGVPKTIDLPTDSFFVQLLSAPVATSWLRPLPFGLPDHPALRGSDVRVWEVVPPMESPGAAAAAAIQAWLESGRADLAARLAPTVEAHDDLPSLLARATLAAVARDEARFRAALQRILPRLGEAPRLTLGQRLQLVSLLALAQQYAPAGAQLTDALRAADATAIRSLTTGQLGDLLSLTDALAPGALAPDNRALALRLLPPARRP